MNGRADGQEATNLQPLLRDASVEVTLSKCDTSYAEDTASSVDAIAVRRVGGHGIAGILLAGGVLNDAVLASQTARKLSSCCLDCR